MTGKPVLLARPHAFIVGEMRPFLIDAGYDPQRLESLGDLAAALRRPYRGAIISTAISSPVGADAPTMFRLIREVALQLPIVFAGMADAATMRSVVGRAVEQLAPNPVVASPLDYKPSAACASTFLILRKEDLMTEGSYAAAVRALRLHFG